MKVAVSLLVLLCAFQFAYAQAIMEPADRPVTLTGTIREMHAYGPPGWGETKKTDAKFSYLVIELQKPINIPCTPERPEWRSIDCKSTRQLQLFVSSDSPSELELTAKKLRGKRAAVTGTLQWHVAPGEMTPIYINVTAIQASPIGS
jgi:hypothetical protein